ncbi:MAG: hypothetical protein E6K70_26365 [Planctomycetota bacterium]|nr:MAG: hypothetical protein E6K70_26365 [Planctomycetota bacterium]
MAYLICFEDDLCLCLLVPGNTMNVQLQAVLEHRQLAAGEEAMIGERVGIARQAAMAWRQIG